MPNNDPLKSVENIVQLPSARRTLSEPVLHMQRAQPMQPVLFEGWVAARDRAAAALLSGTKRLLLTGPAGTGKTVLIDHIARVLRAAGRTVVIQLADADPAPPGPGVTMFVDEADRLSAPKLQQLLSNAAGTVVLAGLDPLGRRVAAGTMQVTLNPLGQRESQDYIARWLALNGRTSAELDSNAVRALVELSGGVPRLLSTLLTAGAWLAKSSGAPVIEAVHIREAAELRSVLGPATPPDTVVVAPARRGRVIWSALLAGGVLAGTAGAIAPRLFPAETDQVMARAAPFVAQAERWLRGEPAVRPPQAVEAPVQPVTPVPVQPAPPPVEPAPVAIAPAQTAAVETAPVAPIPAEPPVSEPPKSAADVPPPEPAPEPMPTALEPAQSAMAPEAKPPEPPAPEAPAPAVLPATTLTLPVETLELLLRRGREMLAIDDLSAARLLFLRAAEAGSTQAMLELGQTYDPSIRSNFGAPAQADRAEALRWYRRAGDKGNHAAETLLSKP